MEKLSTLKVCCMEGMQRPCCSLGAIGLVQPAALSCNPILSLSLSTDFDRAEVGQPKAEGRERSPHSCHQQALQIGILSKGRMKRGALRKLPTPPPSPTPLFFFLLSSTASISAMGSICHTCLALPFAVHSLSALISPTTHTPTILLFLI